VSRYNFLQSHIERFINKECKIFYSPDNDRQVPSKSEGTRPVEIGFKEMDI
jgi:hypothetical protein